MKGKDDQVIAKIPAFPTPLAKAPSEEQRLDISIVAYWEQVVGLVMEEDA